MPYCSSILDWFLPINIGDSTFATLKQEFKATTPPHFIGSCISGSTPTKDVRTLPPADVLQSLTHPTQVYVFSKTLAHRAVTDWIAEHPNLHFNVVRVLPGYIQGANELSTSPEQILASSAEGTLNMALGNVSATEPKLLDQVHLDDAARAHMAALDRKTVASSSLLLPVGNGGSGWSWDDFVPVMERLFPDEVKTGILKPRKGQADLAMQFDVSETYSVLEWEFAGLEEMVCDVVGQYLRLWEAGGGR
ncbi:hypothetical protein LTS02_016730 [Friedmanniomyces endolithicus]|nr:hypothetical protein LTS02_016730 [Friedmanniomyces endolithicus]